VLLDEIGEGQIRLIDGGWLKVLPIREFESIWSGYAIVVGDLDESQDRLYGLPARNWLKLLGIALLASAAATLAIGYLKWKHGQDTKSL